MEMLLNQQQSCDIKNLFMNGTKILKPQCSTSTPGVHDLVYNVHASFSSFLFTHSILFQNFYMQPTFVLKFRFISATKYFVLRSGYKRIKNCTDSKLDKWQVQIFFWINGDNKGEDEVQGYLQVPLASFSHCFFSRNFTMQLTIAGKNSEKA